MNEVILIIGASSDIGAKLISTFDSEIKVIAHFNNSLQVIDKIRDTSKCKIYPVQADLANDESVKKMISEIRESHGVPSKIVFLASNRIENIRFKDINWSDFSETIDVGLKPAVNILNDFMPEMAKRKSGKVVFMLSSYVLGTPPKALSHYTVSKYALLGLAKSLAAEFASYNIQINSVSPSMIDTKFLQNINPRVVEFTAEGHPLKRNATVDDIVPALSLLLSSESDYITGINIPITGGAK